MKLILIVSLVFALQTGSDPVEEDIGRFALGPCKPTPGKVNRCSNYSIPKVGPDGLIRKDLRWVPNEDPAACTQALHHNLDSLSDFYGKRPEISLPNANLLEKLDRLEVPPPTSAAIAPMASEEPDSDQSLLLRIRSVISRLARLGTRLDYLEPYLAASQSWTEALNAGQRLDPKLEEVDRVLSTGEEWPSLEEFGIGIWGLTVCDTFQADLVSRLKSRLEKDSPDSVWSFVLADDWLALTVPFDESGLDRFEKLGLPFFIEDRAVANERQDKSLLTLREVRRFREGIAQVTEKIALLVAQREVQQSEALIALRGSFVSESAIIGALRSELLRREEQLVSTKGELDKAIEVRDTLAFDIEKQQASIEEADHHSNEMLETVGTARAAHQRARSATEEARQRQQVAEEQLEAIRLDCGGADYSSCTDEAAKLEYDRRRYEAQSVLSTARQEFMTSLSRELETLEAAGRAERELIDQQSEAVELRLALAGMLERVAPSQQLAERLEGEWRQSEGELELLHSTARVLDETLASIQVRLEEVISDI